MKTIIFISIYTVLVLSAIFLISDDEEEIKKEPDKIEKKHRYQKPKKIIYYRYA